MTPSGIEPATFRFVAQHLNHCATAVPYICINTLHKGGNDDDDDDDNNNNNNNTANVEPEMYDHTSNNWRHWDSNEKL